MPMATRLAQAQFVIFFGSLNLFTRLMIRHGVGCHIEETLDIRKIDQEFFE
jgi:restriction endonuclease Mrr